eukprot:scaffold165788_cov20-Tisochrysis_lutea.AAC.3
MIISKRCIMSAQCTENNWPEMDSSLEWQQAQDSPPGTPNPKSCAPQAQTWRGSRHRSRNSVMTTSRIPCPADSNLEGQPPQEPQFHGPDILNFVLCRLKPGGAAGPVASSGPRINMLTEGVFKAYMDDAMASMREDVRNLHIEMLKQFHVQQ